MLITWLQKYFSISLLLLVLIFLFISNFTMGSEMKTWLPEDIGHMTKWKSRAEAWALKIKKDYPINSEQYNQAFAYYIEAKAAVDAWIVSLKTDLILSGNINKSESYNRLLDEAARKSHNFIQYSEKLYTVPRGKLSTFATILKDFTEIVTTIWEQFKKANEAKREEIRAVLEDLRWKSFDEI